MIPRCNTVHYGKNSFKYQGSKLWNNLKDEIKSLEYDMFRKCIIGNYTPNECFCSTCNLCKLELM